MKRRKPDRSATSPVTVRGRDGKPHLDLARVWTGWQGEAWDKHATIVVWRGPDDRPEVLAETIVEEADLIAALGLLFPHGELERRRKGDPDDEAM